MICKESTELNFLNHIATKVVRLGELCNGKEPKNESIGDTTTRPFKLCLSYETIYRQ